MPHDQPPPTVFFDNGFLRNLIHKETSERFWEKFRSVAPSELSNPSQGLHPWRTPFSIIEWIGLSPKDLSPFKFTLSKPITPDLLEKLLSDGIAHFAANPTLRASTLQKSFEDQTQYVHPAVRKIWNSLFFEVFTREFAGWLHTALSFDALQKYNPQPKVRCQWYGGLSEIGFFSANDAVRNLSKYRLANRLALWRKEISERKSRTTEDSALFEEFYKTIKMKNRSDFADTDLIHIATMGVEKHYNIRSPAVCVTCDSPLQVELRIGVYRGVIASARKIFSADADRLGLPPDLDRAWNGEVYFFNNDGEFVKRLNVGKGTVPISVV